MRIEVFEGPQGLWITRKSIGDVRQAFTGGRTVRKGEYEFQGTAA